MYTSFGNQLYVLLHFSFALLLLMVWIPKWLFKLPANADRWMAGYLRIVFVYIVIGYVLVLLKLFEVLAILAVLGLYASRHYLKRTAQAARMNAFTAIGLMFYEALDVGFQLRQNWERLRARLTRKQVFERFRARPTATWWTTGALLLVLGVAAYLRFADALTQAAPAMSDGYVTLAWMKYIEQRVLFHDGIYPQGFHITLAYLHKFAAIDQLYVLKLTGPLNGVLTTYGLYFAVSRWTGNRWAGIAAAVLYGLAGVPLHGQDWIRQATTNSQEFAMVFVFPVFYFLAKYLQRGEREDLWTGAAGLSVIGLVHTLVFAYAGMGLAVVMFVGFVLSLRTMGRRVWNLTLVGAAAVVIALLPFGLGELLGRGLHGSSEEFLTSKVSVTLPDLHLWDGLALAALVPLVLAFLFRRKPFREKVFEFTAILIIAASFVLYYVAPTVTQSLVLATRTGSLWAMAIPFSVGLGLHALFLPLQRMRSLSVWQGIVCVGLVVVCVRQTQLELIDPYKMEWNHGVEQYLQIAEHNRPKTWAVISQNEGYSLVLGNGYHIYMKDFLDRYDPTLPPLTHYGWDQPDPNLPNEIYLYHEKQVFEVSTSNSVYTLLAPQYEQRKQENAKLEQWIETYKSHHAELEVFYEDETLCIYHLHKEEDTETKQQKLWGKSH
ncbi:hypothetical protein [Tumebacillus permanentifrigoris]|uniref:Dolichyl-phosphate-mannose-protein mannosyltransferase n=1 Tax=Tumebacillus permanentifrigoris TaxID=378543 RepID=A0A316DXX2_9BACL|nr:hypothetical protein [Tumebacillus permanentifrigoris]PWK14961.1 hypothetical protein C7459_104165 [Tumebacillus permanentifrigoris]